MAYDPIEPDHGSGSEWYYANKNKGIVMNIEEIEKAIKILGPVAAMHGLTKDDTRIIIKYVDEMKERGISGGGAAIALRNHMKSKKPKKYTVLGDEMIEVDVGIENHKNRNK